jgi:hypothetical protein
MDQHPILHTAVYDDVDAALAELELLEHQHEQEFIGDYAATVLEWRDGNSRVVAQVGDPLSPEQLSNAAHELADGQFAVVVLGEATVERGLDAAVARAGEKIKHRLRIGR